MARPGGKEVGRVSIRVLPDATKFRNDLKLLLKRVENSMSANLSVRADVRPAQAALNRFKKDWDGREVDLAATVGTAAARASLAVLARTRVVELVVRVSQSSVARAGSILAALSGGRLAGDFLKNIGERLGNLDRALPRLASVALGIASIGSVALSSIGGVFTLGSSLAQLAGLSAMLPALLGAMATSAIVFGVALADAKNQLAVLGPEFRNLRTIITDNFWARARQPVLDFANSVLPQLRVGLAGTATALGAWTASVAQGFQKALGGGVIETLFANLNRSIGIASTGTGGFADALVRLGVIGSTYLPSLAQWVADLSNRFAAFVQQAEADGTLTRAIDAGIVAAQQLGSVLLSVVQIWGGISDAAQMAGGGGLATVAAVLAQIAAVVNGPVFQVALAQIFAGASAGAAGLFAALGPIGDFFAAFAPTLSNILATSGQVVGQFVGLVASAMSDPAFTSGLGLFFAGIQSGLTAITPALPALAQAFGAVASFAGLLASNLGPVLGALIQALAPALTAVMGALQPLLPALGGALVGAITMVAPLLTELITMLLPPLVEYFAQLAPALLPLIEAVLPIVAALLPVILTVVQALIPMAQAILPVLKPIVDLLALILVPVLQMLTPLIQLFGAITAMAFEFIGAVVQTAVLLVVGLLTGDLQGALGQIGAVWVQAFSNMRNIFSTIWDAIVGIGKAAFNSLIIVVEAVVNGIILGVNLILETVRGAASALSTLTGGAVNITVPKLQGISIPKLAIGADIMPRLGGTLALLGEGGRAETVTDLGRTNRLITLANILASRALSLRGAGDAPQITVVAAPGDDPRTTAAVVWREFDDETNGGR